MKTITVLDVINAIEFNYKEGLKLEPYESMTITDLKTQEKLKFSQKMLRTDVYHFLNHTDHELARKFIESIPINLNSLVIYAVFRGSSFRKFAMDMYDQTVHVQCDPSGIIKINRPLSDTAVTIENISYNIDSTIARDVITLCNEISLNNSLFEDQWWAYRRDNNLSAFGIEMYVGINLKVADVIKKGGYDVTYSLQTTDTLDTITLKGSEFITSVRNGIVCTEILTPVDPHTAVHGSVHLAAIIRNKLRLYVHLLNQVTKD